MTLPNNQHNALPFLTPQTTNRDSIKEKVLGEGGVLLNKDIEQKTKLTY